MKAHRVSLLLVAPTATVVIRPLTIVMAEPSVVAYHSTRPFHVKYNKNEFQCSLKWFRL